MASFASPHMVRLLSHFGNHEGGKIVMRKSLVLLLLLLLFCSPPGPAVAGPYATEVTQILSHVQHVLSYAAQANQLATQYKILADAIKNTVNNPHQLFWNIQADLNALAGIVQGDRKSTRLNFSHLVISYVLLFFFKRYTQNNSTH